MDSDLFNKHTGAALGLIIGIMMGSLLLNAAHAEKRRSVIAPAKTMQMERRAAGVDGTLRTGS